MHDKPQIVVKQDSQGRWRDKSGKFIVPVTKTPKLPKEKA